MRRRCGDTRGPAIRSPTFAPVDGTCSSFGSQVSSARFWMPSNESMPLFLPPGLRPGQSNAVGLGRPRRMSSRRSLTASGLAIGTAAALRATCARGFRLTRLACPARARLPRLHRRRAPLQCIARERRTAAATSGIGSPVNVAPHPSGNAASAPSSSVSPGGRETTSA